MHKIQWSLLLSVLAIIPLSVKNTSILATTKTIPQQEIGWDQLQFPEYFQWGAATSAFQIEGTQTANGRHIENSWTRYADKLPQPGIASDHWTRFKEDVQLIKQAGLTWYRFSIEWSKIMPEQGVYDQTAMDHYVALVDELIANGIEPVVCLWHYTWPVWFDDLGAFEKSANIQYFVDFADYIFANLGNKVRYWMTLNQPVGYCLEGYVRGKYPPCKKLRGSHFLKDFKRCGHVIYNMLDAHIRIYHLFKQERPDAQIGFCKIFQPLYPYNNYNPIERFICSQMNYLLHDVALEFFKTGTFNWFGFSKKNMHAPHSLDWLGINYYTRNVIKFSLPCSFKICHGTNASIIDGNREFYPAGLRWAIRKAGSILPNIPLYITENGTNDPENTWKDTFYLQHLIVVAEEMAAGYDIRGYNVWALMDSFSWKRGTDSKMGLYHVNETTYDRTLYSGVHDFIAYVKKHTQAIA